MAEISQISRRWNAFVCPDCRHVFRVPGDYEGRGVVCPACHRMLRLPEAGETTPPLVVANRRKKRSSSQSHRERQEERIFDETFADKESTSPVLVKVIVAAAISSVILIVAGLLWPEGGKAPARPADRSDLAVATGADDASPGEAGDAELIDEPLRATMVERELAPVVEAFLTAETIGEALRFARRPDRARPRMETFYADGFEPVGFREMTLGHDILRDGRWARVSVVAEDFSEQTVWLGRNEDGEWKVDWESWAGWSPWTWDEIREGEPDGPFTLRVQLNDVDYYNFDFADESEWSSYSLRGPSDDRPLYGYARRGSPTDLRLGLHEKTRNRRFLLRVRLPEGAINPNQLRIEQVLADDWLDPDDGP